MALIENSPRLSEHTNPFVIELISRLIDKEFVSEAIMLPLLVGAYKIKNDYHGESNIDFLKDVYHEVLESLYTADKYLYLKTCESSNNFVLKTCETKPSEANTTITYRDKAVIYCEKSIFDRVEIDYKEAEIYFLNKFIETSIKYCNFKSEDGYDRMVALQHDDKFSEIDVIKSLISSY